VIDAPVAVAIALGADFGLAGMHDRIGRRVVADVVVCVVVPVLIPGMAPNFSGTLTLTAPTFGNPKCDDIQAIAKNSCGAISTATVALTLASYFCKPCPFYREVRTYTWSSDLALEGGRLQVATKGAVSFPGRGRAYGVGPLVEGENRVEATVVEGAGKPGLWRFDFVDSYADVGSIHVVAGEVVDVAATSVTFRLAGTPGERIVFTFGRK
jgi:hypothetical protein